MPTAARVLPGLNMLHMLHCAHAPASSLQFVDGQELLSALLNSSPLFHLASCLHGLMSYFTGCPCVLRVLFFWGFVCFGVLVVGSLPVGYNLVCSSILTRLRCLCRTCTHSASTRAKKDSSTEPEPDECEDLLCPEEACLSG